MDKPIFISGWAGYPSLFYELISDYDVIVPFIDLSPQQIIDRICSSKRNIAVGWSTGAHILLAHLDQLDSHLQQIFLFSPFEKFTNHTDPRIIKMMIRKLKSAPEKVVRDFYINCGITAPEHIEDVEHPIDCLIAGLTYLINSDAQIETQGSTSVNIQIFHGKSDQIVPWKSSAYLHNKLPSSSVTYLDAEHYIKGNRIIELINENLS